MKTRHWLNAKLSPLRSDASVITRANVFPRKNGHFRSLEGDEVHGYRILLLIPGVRNSIANVRYPGGAGPEIARSRAWNCRCIFHCHSPQPGGKTRFNRSLFPFLRDRSLPVESTERVSKVFGLIRRSKHEVVKIERENRDEIEGQWSQIDMSIDWSFSSSTNRYRSLRIVTWFFDQFSIRFIFFCFSFHFFRFKMILVLESTKWNLQNLLS